MLLVDTETTGVDPETARIVTAAAILVSPDGVIERRTWIFNPGVEIPEEATNVHKITTEYVRAWGSPTREVIGELAGMIRRAWGDRGKNSTPLVGMNLVYDLTVIQRELARYGFEPLEIGPCLDPYVIDRACDHYRKGSRKLEALAAYYGIKFDGAHSAEQDALAAGRVLWKQLGFTDTSVDGREVDYSPLHHLSLAELQVWQARSHAARQASFQHYLRTKKVPPEPDAIVDGSWPVRPAP